MRRLLAWGSEERIIKEQARKNKSIIYGGQSIKRIIGSLLARPTRDWDILSKRPKRSAHTLQGALDKIAGGNFYYSTPSKYHKSTHKVYNVGADSKRGTKDDIGIADFSKPRKGFKYRNFGGLRFARLSETIKDKKKALSDPQFSFRHKKDSQDIYLIRLSRKVRRY